MPQHQPQQRALFQGLLQPLRRGASSRPGGAAAAGLLHAAQQQHEAFIVLACTDEPSQALAGALSDPHMVQAAAAGSKLRLQLATTGRGCARQLPQRQGGAHALQQQRQPPPPAAQPSLQAPEPSGQDGELQRLEQQLLQLCPENAARQRIAEVLGLQPSHSYSCSYSHTGPLSNGTDSLPGAAAASAVKAANQAHARAQQGDGGLTAVAGQPLAAEHAEPLAALLTIGKELEEELENAADDDALQRVQRRLLAWVKVVMVQGPLRKLLDLHSGIWRRLLEAAAAGGGGHGPTQWAHSDAGQATLKTAPAVLFRLLLLAADLTSEGSSLEELSPDACVAVERLFMQLMQGEQDVRVYRHIQRSKLQLLRVVADPALRPPGARYGGTEHIHAAARAARRDLALADSDLDKVAAAVFGASQRPLPALHRAKLMDQLTRPEWAVQPAACRFTQAVYAQSEAADGGAEGGSGQRQVNKDVADFLKRKLIPELFAVLGMQEELQDLRVLHRDWERTLHMWLGEAGGVPDSGRMVVRLLAPEGRHSAMLLRDGTFAAGLLACHGLPLQDLSFATCLDYHTLLLHIKECDPQIDPAFLSRSTSSGGSSRTLADGAEGRHQWLLRQLKAFPLPGTDAPEGALFKHIKNLCTYALRCSFGEAPGAPAAAAAVLPESQLQPPPPQQQQRVGGGRGMCPEPGSHGANGSVSGGMGVGAGGATPPLSSGGERGVTSEEEQSQLQQVQQREREAGGAEGGSRRASDGGGRAAPAVAFSAGGPNCLLPGCGAQKVAAALRWLWGAALSPGAGQPASFTAVGGPQMALALVALHACCHAQQLEQEGLQALRQSLAAAPARRSSGGGGSGSARVSCLAFQPMCSAPFAARWLPEEQRRNMEAAAAEAATGCGTPSGSGRQHQAVFPPPPGVDGVVALTQLGARVPADAVQELQEAARRLGKARAQRVASTAAVRLHRRDSACFDAAYEEAARRMVAAPRGEAAPLVLEARGTEGLEAAMLLAAKVRGSLALQRRDACVWLDGLAMDWDDPRDAARMKGQPHLHSDVINTLGSSRADCSSSAVGSDQLLFMQAINTLSSVVRTDYMHGRTATASDAALGEAGDEGRSERLTVWLAHSVLLPLLRGLPPDNMLHTTAKAAAAPGAGEREGEREGERCPAVARGLVFSLRVAECEPGRPADLVPLAAHGSARSAKDTNGGGAGAGATLPLARQTAAAKSGGRR